MRERIDRLADERDAAFAALADSISANEDLERRIRLAHSATSEARRSREMWKRRARNAEAMVRA